MMVGARHLYRVCSTAPGGSWGWPYKARHKRPRSTPIATLVFSPVLLFFFNRQSRIVSHMFALRFSAVLPGLEPPMFYLRKKNTKFDAKSDDRCSVSKGKWQKEAVLWAACTFKRWPVRLTAINLPIDHVLRLFYRVVLTPRSLIFSC